MQPNTAGVTFARAALGRAGVLGGLWLAFTGAGPQAWGWGLAAVGASVALSLAMLPPQPRRWRALRVLALLPHVAKLAVLGGADVASRAFRPSMPLRPELLSIPLPGVPQDTGIVLAYLLAITPGTLAVELESERLVLHVIDRGLDTEQVATELLRRLRAAQGIGT